MSKYHSKRIIINRETFDSKKEALRFKELCFMQRAGRISNLQRQVKYVLIPAQHEKTNEIYTKGARKGEYKDGKLLERECAYYADFVYIDCRTGETVVEDVKGYRGGEAYAIFKLKKKLMLYVHKIKVKEV